MFVFTWNDSLKTENSRIDRDNRLILEKAHELGQSISSRKEDFQIIEDLIELKKVVREHFEQEEMMQQYDHFNDYYVHKNSHAQFLKQLNKLSSKIMRNPSSQTHLAELGALMSEYCNDHIQKYDTEVAKFFMNRDFYKI